MKKLTLLLVLVFAFCAIATACSSTPPATTSSDETSEEASAAAATDATADATAAGDEESTDDAATSGEKFKVGFSMDFTTNVWRAVMLEKLEAAAAEHADEMDLIVTNADADSNKQISDVEDLVSQGIDLLIITPYVSEPLTPIIEEVYDKGIPVIVIDHTIDSDKYTSFIGASNAQIGERAGESIVEILGGEGNVIEISGTPGMSATIDRGDVMHEVVEQSPGIKFLATLDGNYDQATAMKVMEDALQSQNVEDIDLIYAHNDGMALGALQTLIDAGYGDLGIKILSIDAQKKALEYIKEGKMYGTFTYPWPSEEAIETALKVLKGEDVEKNIELESVLITSENVDEYYDPTSDY